MDQATEYLLLQEAEWSRIVNNLKSIIPNAQKVFLKPNINALKRVGKKLGGKEFKFIERDAIRRIPGFKKDYAEAQRKVPRLKFASAATSKGIALTTAMVSSVTGRSVDEVMKKGEMGVRNSKILPIPSMFQLVTFGLFITFIMSIFLSDGAVILPTIQIVLHIIGMLILALGQIIKVLLKIAGMGDSPEWGGWGNEVGGESFKDALTSSSDIPGDVGLINPQAAMEWIWANLGF